MSNSSKSSPRSQKSIHTQTSRDHSRSLARSSYTCAVSFPYKKVRGGHRHSLFAKISEQLPERKNSPKISQTSTCSYTTNIQVYTQWPLPQHKNCPPLNLKPQNLNHHRQTGDLHHHKPSVITAQINRKASSAKDSSTKTQGRTLQQKRKKKKRGPQQQEEEEQIARGWSSHFMSSHVCVWRIILTRC